MSRFRAYGWALGIVAALTVIGFPVRGVIEPGNLTMIYMTGVVVAAARLGVGPAVFASCLSVAAFNFFFTLPYYSFQSDSRYYLTFAVMLITSIVVGSLTAKVSKEARVEAQKGREIRALYLFSRHLSAIRGGFGLAKSAAETLAGDYQVAARVWRCGENVLEPLYGTNDVESDTIIPEWVIANRCPAGLDTGVMASSPALYLPLMAHNEVLGVLRLIPDAAERHFTAVEREQFETIATLLAAALDRDRQTDAAETAISDRETERARNVLLASLSHDLRTPLTVMNGGLSALLRMRRKLPREAMDEVTRLWTQLNRLQGFVANLLRMAALTSGQMKLNLQPYMVQEIIGAALGQVSAHKGGRAIRTVMTGTLPMVTLDGALVEQVLVNLLENACRHTGETGVIVVAAERDGAAVRVSVSDDGPGLPAGAEGQVFAQFHREAPDDSPSGAGLGLAICKAIVEAHGGQIEAMTRPEGGARFSFTLPILPVNVGEAA